MREILFRGKRKENEKWIDGGYSEFRNFSGEEVYNIIHNGYANEVIPETIGQYTGLTDKNGKNIFEGDIMPVWENGEEYHYKVIYNGDCFMLSMLDSEQGSYPLSVRNSISEVIGNIHDNPELLGGGTE